jgi:hypothetical protein
MKRILFFTISFWVLHLACSAQGWYAGESGVKKPLSVLLENQKQGWDVITQWKSIARNKVEVLPTRGPQADSVLYRTQFSAGTPIGAIVYGCGGIFIEDGWMRIIGSGCNQFDRNIYDWNIEKSSCKFRDQSSYILIADDVIGGMYGMKTEGPEEITKGKVYYFGPNSLRWEATGLSYAGFINFCFSGNLDNFYGDFQWKNWRDEVKKLNGNQVISCYPLLWTKEGKEIKYNRKVISIQKQWDLYHTDVKPLSKKSGTSTNVTSEANKNSLKKSRRK